MQALPTAADGRNNQVCGCFFDTVVVLLASSTVELLVTGIEKLLLVTGIADYFSWKILKIECFLACWLRKI